MEEAKPTLHGLARCTEDECFGGALGKGCFLMMEAEPMGRVCQGRYRETQRKKRQDTRRSGKGGQEQARRSIHSGSHVFFLILNLMENSILEETKENIISLSRFSISFDTQFPLYTCLSIRLQDGKARGL